MTTVDYEAMSGRELQDELAKRGLPAARASKAVMVQRLLDNDTDGPAPVVEPYDKGGVLLPAMAEAANDSGAPEPVLPAAAVEPDAPAVFRMDFAAEPGGPDEETHLTYRTTTVQAAADAGHEPRGDARLAATVDGRWVYEVMLRRPR
jgi:hypothetical protein